MEIIKNFPTDKYPATAVTIGNFDGCHHGHRLLLEATMRLAEAHHHRSVVISFVDADKPVVERLFTAAQKLRSFTALGLHTCLLHKFDRSLTDISHQDFLHDRLRQCLNMHHLVVGYDFCFGHRRRGNVDWLKTQTGFSLTAIAPLARAGQRISSSAVRQLLAAGKVGTAAAMLGRAYMLEGEVQRGEQRGSKLGIPTANLGSIEQLLPAEGVYAGWAVLAAECSPLAVPAAAKPSVINIGTRPTVSDDGRRTVEVHVIAEKLGELYGKRMAVFFVQRLRAEKKFDDIEALRTQIDADITQARRVLSAR